MRKYVLIGEIDKIEIHPRSNAIHLSIVRFPVWYCICAHESYISIVENRNRILISNTLLICDIFRSSDLPPTIPRSSARVRKMVAVSFLIPKVLQRMSGIRSPYLVPCGNRLRAYGEPDTPQTYITPPSMFL